MEEGVGGMMMVGEGRAKPRGNELKVVRNGTGVGRREGPDKGIWTKEE